MIATILHIQKNKGCNKLRCYIPLFCVLPPHGGERNRTFTLNYRLTFAFPSYFWCEL